MRSIMYLFEYSSISQLILDCPTPEANLKSSPVPRLEQTHSPSLDLLSPATYLHTF